MPNKKKKKYPLDEINDGNKEILFDLFDSHGIETVTVTFDGGGDSGQIEDIDIPEELGKQVVKGAKVGNGRVWSPETGGWTETYNSDPTVMELTEGFCYSVLENLYGGWENNDGAYGDFTFHVKDRAVSFDFNERYTETRLYEHEF